MVVTFQLRAKLAFRGSTLNPLSAVCVQKRQSWKDRSLSLRRDQEPLELSGGVAYPSAGRQTIASTKARSLAISSLLLAISLLLVAAIETQLKQSVAKTLERVGRSVKDN